TWRLRDRRWATRLRAPGKVLSGVIVQSFVTMTSRTSMVALLWSPFCPPGGRARCPARRESNRNARTSRRRDRVLPDGRAAGVGRRRARLGRRCPMSVITLADGARVTLRPIPPEAEPELTALCTRLSPETAYQRFFTVMRRLPPTGRTSWPTWTTTGAWRWWPWVPATT